MDTVGWLFNLKHWLAQRGLAFTQKAREFGLPEPRGLLLLGVQGCGKSLAAKATSTLWNLPLLKLDVGKIFDAYLGSSEKNIREAVRIAEALSLNVLWLDEIDKAFSGMGGGPSGDSGASARVFGTFLTWMQEKTAPVFVLATANNIEVLPPELLRKGFFPLLAWRIGYFQTAHTCDGFAKTDQIIQTANEVMTIIRSAEIRKSDTLIDKTLLSLYIPHFFNVEKAMTERAGFSIQWHSKCLFRLSSLCGPKAFCILMYNDWRRGNGES